MLKLPSTVSSRLKMRTSESRDCPVRKRRVLVQDPRGGQYCSVPTWRRASIHGAVTDSGDTETKTQAGAEHTNTTVQYLRREKMESSCQLDKAATTSRVSGDSTITHTAPGSVVLCRSARHVQVADRGDYSHSNPGRVLATAVRSDHGKRRPPHDRQTSQRVVCRISP